MNKIKITFLIIFGISGMASANVDKEENELLNNVAQMNILFGCVEQSCINTTDENFYEEYQKFLNYKRCMENSDIVNPITNGCIKHIFGE